MFELSVKWKNYFSCYFLVYITSIQLVLYCQESIFSPTINDFNQTIEFIKMMTNGYHFLNIHVSQLSLNNKQQFEKKNRQGNIKQNKQNKKIYFRPKKRYDIKLNKFMLYL